MAQSRQKELGIVDASWIKALELKIEETFRLKSYNYPKYDATDLTWVYVFNTPQEINPQDAARKAKFNPFNLRLPYELEGYDRLFDSNQIASSKYSDYRSFTQELARASYYDFLAQYYLAYLTFLKAINGSMPDLEKLKNLFINKKLFEDAGIKQYSAVSPDKLAKTIKKSESTFLLALIGYLTFDILFSQSSEITTEARIVALQIMNEHFGIEQVAAAFVNFKNAFMLSRNSFGPDKELVYDLIPKRFVSEPEESSGTPHNRLFFENAMIKKLFNVRFYRQTLVLELSIDDGITKLINQYPKELLQVLRAVMKCADATHNAAFYVQLIFSTIGNLANLQGLQKDEVFGDKASFRNNGASKRGYSERSNWALGLEQFGENDIADLQNRSRDELISLLLQARRFVQLSQSSVAQGAVASTASSSTATTSQSPIHAPVQVPAAESSLVKQSLFKEAPKPPAIVDEEIPDELICPISQAPFEKVVLCLLDNRSYEERCIRETLEKFRRSPINNTPMKDDQSVDDVLVKNINLQNLVDDLRRKKPQIALNANLK